MSKVKLCGLRRMEDIEAANRCRPDYIGFVFAKSRRQVDAETAATLRAALDAGIAPVGVFVNQEPAYIADLITRGIIDIAQLHGEEDEAYIQTLRSLCNCPIIKALGVGKSVPTVPAGADYALFDSLSVQRGGTGARFQWALLEDEQDKDYFLAGGLDCGNVAQAVETLAPYCVDVSSGVETDGWKDSAKMQRFVELVRRSS